MNITISVCVIVKNEKSQIRGLIENIGDFADEVVIVDTGSSDGTREIVQECATSSNKIKLFDYKNAGSFHYGIAKNFSIQNATKDYVIVLDADERLNDNFKNNLKDFLLKKKPLVASIVRKDELLPHLIDYPERIIQRSSGILYGTGDQSKVHEQLSHNVSVEKYSETVWHQQRENHYVIRPQRIFSQLELQIDRVPKTKSLIGHIIRGLWYFCYRFNKLYFKRGLYKDGVLGFKYTFMRSLDAFLIELFVGLRPSKNKKL
jgi:glycosyltransferase involved in cell wall biosynthesis